MSLIPAPEQLLLQTQGPARRLGKGGYKTVPVLLEPPPNPGWSHSVGAPGACGSQKAPGARVGAGALDFLALRPQNSQRAQELD